MPFLQVAEDMRPVGPALSLCPLRRFGVSVLSARVRKRSACQQIPTEIFVVYPGTFACRGSTYHGKMRRSRDSERYGKRSCNRLSRLSSRRVQERCPIHGATWV